MSKRPRTEPRTEPRVAREAYRNVLDRTPSAPQRAMSETAQAAENRGRGDPTPDILNQPGGKAILDGMSQAVDGKIDGRTLSDAVDKLADANKKVDKLTETVSTLLATSVDLQKQLAEKTKKKGNWEYIKENAPGAFKWLALLSLGGFLIWMFDDMAKAASGCYRGSTTKQIPETKVSCSEAQCDCNRMICKEGIQCQPCSDECTAANGYYYVWRQYSAIDMVFNTMASGIELLSNGLLSFAEPIATLAIIVGASFLGFMILSFLYKRLNMYLDGLKAKKEAEGHLEPSSYKQLDNRAYKQLETDAALATTFANELVSDPMYTDRPSFRMMPIESEALRASNQRVQMAFKQLLNHAQRLSRK